MLLLLLSWRLALLFSILYSKPKSRGTELCSRCFLCLDPFSYMPFCGLWVCQQWWSFWISFFHCFFESSFTLRYHRYLLIVTLILKWIPSLSGHPFCWWAHSYQRFQLDRAQWSCLLQTFWKSSLQRMLSDQYSSWVPRPWSHFHCPRYPSISLCFLRPPCLGYWFQPTTTFMYEYSSQLLFLQESIVDHPI